MVTNNIVAGARVYGIYIFGDQVCPLKNITVANNQVSNTGAEGIQIATVRDAIVFGNSVTNSGTASPLSGIRIRGEAAIPATTPVTGAANNGSGLIRLTVGTTAGIVTGCKRTVAGVVGATGANGTWTVNLVNATQIDLQGTTFGAAYVSGGTVSGPTITAVSAGAARHPITGGNLVRLTVSDATGLDTNETRIVSGATGTAAPDVNGHWRLLYVDSTHVDLRDSLFVPAHTYSGGAVFTETENYCTDIAMGGNNIDGTAQYGLLAQRAKWLSVSNLKVRNTANSAVVYDICEDGDQTGGSFRQGTVDQNCIVYKDCSRMALCGGRMHSSVSSIGAAVSTQGTCDAITAIGYVASGFNRPFSSLGTGTNFITALINGKGCTTAISNTATGAVNTDNLANP